MEIKDGCVVAMHYTLTNDEGQTLDSSEGNEPMKFLQGAHNIIPGLEEAMIGKKVGDKFEAVVEADKAYGERHEEMIQKVPKSAFQGVDELAVGMSFEAPTEQGNIPVVITEIVDEVVTVDANHPLAGARLTFQVSIEDVREATEEEKEHSHAH